MTLEDALGSIVESKLQPLRAHLERIEAKLETLNGASPSGNLTTAEAASIARRSQETITRALRAGKLKGTRPEGGREWIIDHDELKRWMTARKPVDMATEVERVYRRVRGRPGRTRPRRRKRR